MNLPKLSELTPSFNTSSAHSTVTNGKYLAKGVTLMGLKLDYDVRLKSYGVDLQRPFVWSLRQQREWIWSVLKNKSLPPVAVSQNDMYEDKVFVIDGKQRLMTLQSFLNDGFTLIEDLKFSDLPEDYQKQLKYFHIQGFVTYDLTDEQMLEWFRYLNYAGTPQDAEHIQKLEQLRQLKSD
jgi:hypothetical protein